MILSSSQLETVRTRPQSSRLYLSIFEPTVIFQAQVNGSLSKGAREIPFDNVTLGSWTAIDNNFTAYIGSIAGASDIGTIRVRSATSSQLVVSENSNIEWADDLFITVVRFISLDPVYPRIIQNPSDDEDVIFYKDWDIPYSNQNSILGTFVNMGSHRAAFRQGGSVQINYTSTGTHNLLGSNLSFHWFFEGGTPSGSTSRDPGLITYNSTGHFATRLIVSGSAGETDRGYRYVSIYDKPWQGTDVPILSWELVSFNGSRDQGGYRAGFRIHENIDIKENAVVVLFEDAWYGSTNQSFNKEGIFFVGYVLKDTISYNYQHSEVSFEVGSLTEFMKTALGFSVSVESKAAPTKWYELYDMDCRRAIFHYLKWHTMVNRVADFQFIGTDQKIQFFDSDRTSMYDAIDNFMRNTLLGQVVSDRQGKVWLEVEAKAYTNPTGSFTSVMDITKRDWRNEPSIDEQLSNKTSFLELGGVAYTGVHINTFSALIASAPGNTPSFRGKVDTRSGMALSSQSDLNQIAGNVWANDNAPFPMISMDLAGNYSHLDIAPQEAVSVSILPSDTVRNKLIQGLYIPSGFDWQYNHREGMLLPSVDLKSLINGAAGQTVEIPITPADAGINTGFSVPGLQIPPLPVLTAPAYNIPSQQQISAYLAPFGQYIREATLQKIESYSFQVDLAVIFTTELMSVQFDVEVGGMYQCNLFFTANQFILSGDREFATMTFSNDSGYNDSLRGHAFAANAGDTEGAVRLSGSLSGILRANNNSTLLASVSPGGVTFSAANTTFFCSVVRIGSFTP